MVNHSCPNCGIIFSKKSTFDYHINRKRPCVKVNNIFVKELPQTPPELPQTPPELPQTPPELPQTPPEFTQNIPLCIEIKSNNVIEDKEKNKNNKFSCPFCLQNFVKKYGVDRHLNGRCKFKKESEKIQENFQINFPLMEKDNKLDYIIKILNQLEENNKINKADKYGKVIKINEIKKIHKTVKKMENTIPANMNLNINNQLLEQLMQKDKKIEELVKTSNRSDKNNVKIFNKFDEFNEFDKSNESDELKEIKEFEELEISEQKPMTLILNNDIIECRKSDGFINATQLCKAGGKNFGHWFRLDSTKQLIRELAIQINNKDNLFDNNHIESNIQNWILDLIDKKIGGNHSSTWIHPDLAIQLAQWISPIFALQISHWIRTLFTQGKVEVDIKVIKEKDNVIKNYKKRIEYLEKITLKRISRKNLDKANNVVYLITCDELEVNRKYIIGKAKDLLNRMSQYDKLSNCRTIYSKTFNNIDDAEFAESIILNCLERYKDQMNHDRFILPVDKDIKFFTDVFDNASKCFID
jgi:hypothetical protein